MLYPRSEPAKDAEIPPGPAQSGEFSIGYFRDLDGHLWEVIWNPRLEHPDA